MSIRILVVEDHESWRRFVTSALRKNHQYQVVGEVADGLDAVQQAARLKPDLIVLDVGLPTLNGIEVARRILTIAPDSKILFLSEHRSRDIAEAAVGTGARGYVLKSNAGADLLAAVEAVIEGKQFISAGVARPVSGRPRDKAASQAARRHELDICSDDDSLLDGFARFVEGALKAGSAAIVTVTSSHRTALHERLQACGLDIDLATKEGRYVSIDVADALAAFMVNGWPDEARFWKAATAQVVQAAKASKGLHPRVVTCGECAPSLLREGHGGAAVRVERLSDELARIHDMDIWCGYALTAPQDDENRIFQQICAEHSAIHRK